MNSRDRNAESLERLYAALLHLYPPQFKEAYAPMMRQAFRDALADRSLARESFLPLVLRDLITSLIKEHFAMVRETFGRPVLMFNALVLAGLATVLALALYAIPQQVLRLGADDPQLQLADDLAAKLEQGISPTDAVPTKLVDVGRSLAPFVIAYDANGRPLATQAQLDGATPTPPRGVFDFVRRHGKEKITWQPRNGLRFAAVVQRVDGPAGGFVVAGRSMHEVESRIGAIQSMAGLAWMAMLGLILAGTVAFGWFMRKAPAVA